MNLVAKRLPLLLSVLIVGGIAVPTSILAKEADWASKLEALSSIGKVGPQAAQLKLWTSVAPDGKLNAGDRLTLRFSVPVPAYVLAISLTSAGDVAVHYPCARAADLRAGPKNQYVLKHKVSSQLSKAGPPGGSTRFVFYVSTEPVDLDTPFLGRPLKIPAGDAKTLDILTKDIGHMAADKTFNRVTVSFKGAVRVDGCFKGKKMMRSKGVHKPRQGRLPSAVPSEDPQSVTGAQGFKPKTGK